MVIQRLLDGFVESISETAPMLMVVGCGLLGESIAREGFEKTYAFFGGIGIGLGINHIFKQLLNSLNELIKAIKENKK